VDEASTADCAFLSHAIVRAGQTCLPADRPILATLHEWLSGKRIHPSVDTLQNMALARFQQLSAPLCAKAVEDTAFYRYGRLLSRNDVGFDARTFACSIEEFHHRMVARSAEFPHAMLATATHDHKRGEDVRARLAVLSEIPEEWAKAVERWIEMSGPQCRANGGSRMPRNGDLAMLFQTIVGAWPFRLGPADQDGLRGFSDRIIAWQQKALREAKLRSDWMAPNEAYERAARDYIGWFFSGQSDLLNEIAAFVQRIAPAGAAKGLAQVLVKLTAPGIADIYQGTEYWDFSLVDPDNRSPVDFVARWKSLGSAHCDELLANWDDGRLKQFLIARLLAVRREIPQLFAEGKYLPLETSGHLAGHFLGFARVLPKCAAITVFCRLPAKLLGGRRGDALCISNYQGTRIRVPPEVQGSFSDAFLPERTVSVGSSAPIGQLLNRMPFAFLTRYSK
jgi:(1->4)-alpha-D-glucan 1-alpha-D-glucosylmutase